MALSPKLLVLDEPVSALDVSIQAQILNLLRDIQRRTGVAYLFIAHDLAVVRHVSDRVAVMYLGRIVETAGRDQLYGSPAPPLHDLAALCRAACRSGSSSARAGAFRCVGEISSGTAVPSGCRFHPRCFRARLVAQAGRVETRHLALRTVADGCVEKDPALEDVAPGIVRPATSMQSIGSTQTTCRPAERMKKLIIEVRVNEYMMRDGNPNVPWTAEELGRDGREIREPLAPPSSIFMRASPTARRRTRPRTYAAASRAIRDNSDLIVHPTLGQITVAGQEERIRHIVELAQGSGTETRDRRVSTPAQRNIDVYDAATKNFRTTGKVYVNAHETLMLFCRRFAIAA